MKDYWVYMLRCSDGSYYIGITSRIDARVYEHQAGIDAWCYTFARRPVELVFSTSFHEPLAAISVEKQLKGWSRAKKEALIRGDWDAIRELARCYATKAAGVPCHPEPVEG